MPLTLKEVALHCYQAPTHNLNEIPPAKPLYLPKEVNVRLPKCQLSHLLLCDHWLSPCMRVWSLEKPKAAWWMGKEEQNLIEEMESLPMPLKQGEAGVPRLKLQRKCEIWIVNCWNKALCLETKDWPENMIYDLPGESQELAQISRERSNSFLLGGKKRRRRRVREL